MTDVTKPATQDVPGDVAEMCGEVQYEEVSEIPVERGYVWTSCASVENGNPIFWDESVADAVTGGPIACPSMISVWFRPHHWAPGRAGQALPLQVHFDLKERFGLPEAVMTDNTIEFHAPVRIGDLLKTHQVLRSVSGPKVTKLGEGRFWVIDVVYRNQRDELVAVERYTGFGYVRHAGETRERGEATPTDRAGAADSPERSRDLIPDGPRAGIGTLVRDLSLGDVEVGEKLPELSYDVTATTVVLGAMATRDWRPMHHDKDFAVFRNGTRDIFLNTPNQAAWFERYITDWTGPYGRLGRVKFRMKGSIFPGDTMVFRGGVEGKSVDDHGCGWVDLSLDVSVGSATATSANARIAVPVKAGDNPWSRGAEQWSPAPVDAS